ncbi:hypothetical protein HWV62_17806 [Athelia sp. TMB]|nr:hypothetical protein HWV62_17806 [Athelia sp. TMB]
MDTRKAGESLVLLSCLAWASSKLSGKDVELMGPDDWVSWDLNRLILADSQDDGVLTGVLLGPLIATAMLVTALRQEALTVADPGYQLLPPSWLVERPIVLDGSPLPKTVLEALVLSRRHLVDISTVCSAILLAQVSASWWYESRFQRATNAPEGERASVPRSEGRKFGLYVCFIFGSTMTALCIRAFAVDAGLGIWQNMSYFEIIVCSVLYQLYLFFAIRMAHRGCTVGELSLMCFGGVALTMELMNMTKARIWPVTTPFIKTFRLPSPLLAFQVALVAGSFLVGFLLSPLLWLSRHIAQRPVRRLRFPHEKQRHRRGLAAGFYIGTVFIVGGLIGMWTRWCLDNRDPWLWVLFWLVEGKTPWTRPGLLAYWGLLGTISVAGWNRQLKRSRRYRPRPAAANTNDTIVVPQSDEPPAVTYDGGSLAGGLNFPNLRDNLPSLPNLPNGANVSMRATDFLDAANKHVPTLSLNARRKFFHGLAVAMFLPGVAIDPAFTHLSFSAAFALFTFAEYVRYFAVYPFGAAVHLFMHEFLDHKDSGTAILSHFYLLAGCAGSVWLEGPSHLLQFTGILVLGVGDAMASIVGKRLGKHRWSATTTKTIEGSIAFSASVVAFAWALRLCGVVEPFSILRYTFIANIASLLEALSDQNDNLTLPLFMWCLLAVADV